MVNILMDCRPVAAQSATVAGPGSLESFQQSQQFAAVAELVENEPDRSSR